jgi:hypothetical protein
MEDRTEHWISVACAGALVIAFALRPVTALADHWVTINGDVDVAVIEIDVDSIQSRHGYLSAWLRASYASSRPDGEGSVYRSTLNLYLYDCDAGRSAALQVMEYDDVRGTGKSWRLETIHRKKRNGPTHHQEPRPLTL